MASLHPCSLCSSRTVMSLRWRFGRWPSICQVVGRQAGGGWEADWLSPCAQVQGVVVHHALLKINYLRYWSRLIIWTIFLFRVKADLSSSQNFPMVFSYANDGCCFWSPVLETSVQLHPGNFTNGYKTIQDGLYERFFSFQIWLVFVGVSNVTVNFLGGVVNHPTHSSFGISGKKSRLNPDGNIATFGFVKSLRKSSHHSFRRCGDDGHAGLYVLGFVLGLCWLRYVEMSSWMRFGSWFLRKGWWRWLGIERERVAVFQGWCSPLKNSGTGRDRRPFEMAWNFGVDIR